MTHESPLIPTTLPPKDISMTPLSASLDLSFSTAVLSRRV